MSHQFLFGGPALEVELDHFQGPDGGLPPRPEADEQTGNDGQVDLDGDAVLAVGQQMTATQDAFEPAEKEFHAPAITVAQGDQPGGQVEAAGRQEKNVGTAVGVGLSGFDFEDAQGSLPGLPAPRAAKHDAVAADAGRSGFRRQRPFFDDGPDGVVADAADEVALGVEDVLEELVFGVAAIDNVEAIGLQYIAQLLRLGAAAMRDRDVGRNALEHVEVDVHFGGAVLGIEPVIALPHRFRYRSHVVASKNVSELDPNAYRCLKGMLPTSGGTRCTRRSATDANEVLEALRQRYQRAAKLDKTKILDEFVAVAGCHRKHAIRLLARTVSPKPLPL